MESPEQWIGDVMMLMYGIQFADDPLDGGVDHAMTSVIRRRPDVAPPDRYLASIRAALASQLSLSGLLPQKHSEEVIRSYLSALERRLATDIEEKR